MFSFTVRVIVAKCDPGDTFYTGTKTADVILRTLKGVYTPFCQSAGQCHDSTGVKLR